MNPGGSDATTIPKVGETHEVGNFGADARRQLYKGGGRRSRATTDRRGHYVRSAAPTGKIRAFGDIALDATIRTAAINRTERDADGTRGEIGRRLQVMPTDYRVKVRESKVGNLILFVVDASGSMAARKRMEAVKGSILSLLLDAYQKRDQVGLITFRHRSATLVLPPTNSTDLAQKHLAKLPTGGRTPLSHALMLTYETLRKYKNDNLVPLVILISDCRGNVMIGDRKQLLKPVKFLEQSLEIAGHIQEMGVSSLVIDCEIGRGRWYFSPKIAAGLGGTTVRLDDLSAAQLTDTVRAMT